MERKEFATYYTKYKQSYTEYIKIITKITKENEETVETFTTQRTNTNIQRLRAGDHSVLYSKSTAESNNNTAAQHTVNYAKLHVL